ncbi:hypothetical protein [Pseudomonas brassicacearum]|uniref:hypothetical protein n=1 Tax=Pseudomonas brassicacearum TaxID=930166 RepID=UPI00118274D5|nr:hypothetical protein [Pseudomonas brassicacearum]
MNYFQDFENGLDGWGFTQSDGKIVQEKGGNHYITGDEYVTDYSVAKIFKLPFAEDLPVTVKFKIKVPLGVDLTDLVCILNENDYKPLSPPDGDDQWHSYEVAFPPPPQTSQFPKVRISAIEQGENPPHGLGFDDIEIIQ